MAEKVSDTTVRDISNQRIEEERPCHWVKQRFFDLIHLKMLITDSLLVNPNSSHGQHSVFFLQPTRIQLVVWYNPIEDQAQQDGQHAGEQEDNLPRRDR